MTTFSKLKVYSYLVGLLFVFATSHAQENKKADDLEAKLRQTLETSDEGAKILIELINLYYDEGQVFGLVRSGKTFVSAQTAHPKHEEMMAKLIDGLTVTSQNADLKAAILQYLEKYPKSSKAADFHRRIARIYDRENQRRQAADHYRFSWQKRKPSKGAFADASRAFSLYRDLRSQVTATIMGEMALELMDQLPAGPGATEFGFQAFHQARSYGQQYRLSNQITRNLLSKKLPLNEQQKWQIHHYTGDNLRAEKKYTSSIDSYRKAIAAGSTSTESHRNLIRSLADSQAESKEISKAISNYRKAHPNETAYKVSEMLALGASSMHRAGKTKEAVSQMHEALKLNGHHAQTFVNWMGDKKDWEKAESVYRDSVSKQPSEEWRLHHSMAITHFRDRKKDKEKCVSILKDEVLYKSPLPNAGSSFGYDLRIVLENAKSSADFEKEVRRFVESAKQNGHDQSYVKALDTWLSTYRKSKDDEIRKRYKFVEAEAGKLRKDEGLKVWSSALQNRGRGHSAREQLLKKKLSPQQKQKVLKLHADDLRNHGDSRRRGESIPFYKELAKLEPDNYRSARNWLDATVNYGKAKQAEDALNAIMKLDQSYADHSGWYLAAQAARKTNQPSVMRKAIAWIEKQQGFQKEKNHYAHGITRNIYDLKMVAEEEAFHKKVASREPDHTDTINSINVLASRQPEGEKRIKFLQSYLEPVSEGYGDYVSRIANEYIRMNDLANFEKVGKKALVVRQGRLLKRWQFSLHDWVSRANSNKEWTAEQKAMVYQLCSELGNGRDRAVAKLALLETEGHQYRSIDRLLAYRNLTLESQNDGHSFNHLISWAQKAIGRKEYAEAAAIGTGLLANVTNVGVDYKGRARNLVREAYIKMGALGLEVNANDPIAPLLEIGLHLKLGDQDRALDAYTVNKNRFDEYILQLPVDIIAFAANSHITAGGESNQERAETILRKWLVKHSESSKYTDSDKARIQLLLAKNYNRAKRFEVARSEYTTVVNRYPKTEEAIEAQFGIGETQMSQKIFDQAGETFAELANHPTAKVRIRGMFLQGVLEGRKGNQDEARQIFKEVLGSTPDAALANEALFNLSEVYRDEQRYLEQLELLRTVGRLGQDSKRWHEPGRALSVVVQDSDLGISRGHTRIPVLITTEPGGDREVIHISSGGAGRGLFIGEVETGLGEPEQNNGFLEVTGNDLIKVDYPEDFKSEFQFEPLMTGDIGLAIDADFTMASGEIIDETEETESERLAREIIEQEGDLRRSVQRPANQIKPGNPVYLQVKDLDRNLTTGIDEVLVKITASSGDEVQARLKETGSHSGVFQGSVSTSDLPAGALATDTAIEHSPLMAIDKDENTTWKSQPDGVTPKYLSVDLKQLRTVTKGTFATPDPEDQAPVRARLQGSHDGRYWYPLAEHPQRPNLEIPEGDFKAMTRRVWSGKNYFQEWKQVMRLTSNQPNSQDQVDELTYSKPAPAEADKKRGHKPQPAGVMFRGGFIQPRAGAVRLGIKADQAAVIINGYPALPLVPIQRQHFVDIYLEAGVHDLFVFAATKDAVSRDIEITRSRENPNNSQIRLTRFVKEDFDLNQSFVSNLSRQTDYPLGTMSVGEGGLWQFGIDPRELRHVRFVVDEYTGQAVAINSATIAGAGQTFIPTETDLLRLSSNNQLEITPGDTINSVYIDQLPTGGEPKNRTIDQKLTATYYNGVIDAIAYDFERQGNGQMLGLEKTLLRIDPGERINLKVVDYDMDSTGQRDVVQIKVQIGDSQPRELEATETDNTSGVFKVEIDTIGFDAEEDSSEKIKVKPGDQIYFTYRDQENTFPGHAIDRRSTIYVREPTRGKMRIIESRYTPANEEGKKSDIVWLNENSNENKSVAFEVPLTIEVIDQDAARDSRSEVIVAIALADAEEGSEPIEVACTISSVFSDLDNTLTDVSDPALYQGRFVGQIMMKLGDDGSPRIIPQEPGQRISTQGRVLPPADEDDIEPGMLGVLNLTGKDTITVKYVDNSLPEQESETHTDSARMLGAASLVATDVSYETPVEKLQVGERLFLRLSDPDQDISPERDIIKVSVVSGNGEKESIPLEETLSHSGVFTGSFKLKAKPKPTPGNYSAEQPELEVFFGQALDVSYTDPRPANPENPLVHQVTVPISDGTDGEVAAFTKIFGDEKLAIQTQFHIAESYFELFKSHLKLERKEESDRALRNGRRILRELQEDYPDPKYAPRVAYLLGQFAQELKNWQEAIDAYEKIVKRFPDHVLAADAQYKLGQCYEQANRLDEALEAYVTLAATYPQSPLISNVMIRINDHFYKKEDYEVAAQVGAQFLNRFENHEWAPRMAFRVGQCYYKDEDYKKAGDSFDDFVKRFPDDDLTGQALFWSGESYRQGNNARVAFQRYNRCRWDFPESDAAKYARGRLALPEMIQQFEREAQAVENDSQ